MLFKGIIAVVHVNYSEQHLGTLGFSVWSAQQLLSFVVEFCCRDATAF